MEQRNQKRKMGNYDELVSAATAVNITYAAVEDKVEELLQKCNDKIVESAEEGARGINVKCSYYSYNVCGFVLEMLKSKRNIQMNLDL